MSARLKYRTTNEGERIIKWGYIISIPLLVIWSLFLIDFALPKYQEKDTIVSLHVPTFRSRRSSFKADWVNICMVNNACALHKSNLAYLEIGYDVVLEKSLIFNMPTNLVLDGGKRELNGIWNMVSNWSLNLLIFGLFLMLFVWSYIRIRKLARVLFFIALSIFTVFTYFVIFFTINTKC